MAEIQTDNYLNIFFKSFLTYSEFRHLFITNWKKKFFDSDEDKLIFHFFKKYWVDESKLPTEKDLKLLFINDPRVKNKQDLVEKIESVYNLDISEYTESFVRDYFLGKLRTNKVRFAIREIVEQINKTGKVDELKVKEEILKSLNIDNDIEDLGMDYYGMDVPDRMKLLQEQEKSQFKTTFNKDLDDVLKLKRKTVVAVSAQLGVGKSLWLNNLAVNFTKAGLNVLYLSLEMDTLDISKRVDKMLLDFSDDKYFNDIDIVEGSMTKAKKENKFGHLFIKAYAPRSLAAFQLKALLEKYKLKNIGIDVILVDYLTLMRPNKQQRDDNIYSKGKNITEELQSIAKEENCLIFTALQVKSEAYGKKRQGAELVAESLAIPQLLDTLINMTEWIEEVTEQKYFIINYEKTRDTKKSNKKIYLKLLDNLKIVDVTDEEKIKLEKTLGKKTKAEVIPNNKAYESGKVSDNDLNMSF